MLPPRASSGRRRPSKWRSKPVNIKRCRLLWPGQRVTPGFIRRPINVIALGKPEQKSGESDTPGYPTKANHWLRYLRRVFGWAHEHDQVTTNPAAGIKQVKEKADHCLPSSDAFRRAQAHAKECSTHGPRAKDAIPAHLWAAMELAYQVRLRGIDVLTLTGAHVDGEVLRANHRKDSHDNLVRKGPKQRKPSQCCRPDVRRFGRSNGEVIPVRAESCYLFVSEDGERLTQDGWQTA